ncbi:MAG TPA: fibronectin type III domain-containing protein [Flavobacteriales bacterium]|nr:fibronectin type III domain-containing protein [Flavobacteriales bacterium]
MFVALANAQSINNYGVTRATGISYSSVFSSSNAVNLWRNNSGTYQQDDNRSMPITIGFDFWYNGVRYTQVSVSTNGFLDFSSSADDGGPTNDDFGFLNSAFSNSAVASATRPALAIFYDDLTAQGGVSALGNSVRYQLTGSAPNRVFTAEWINMAVYTNTTPSLNYQVKLYESTGVIEYVYGTMNTGTFSFSYTCGINAPTVSAVPLASELKNQAIANTATFNNTPQNNLVTLPATNSKITFTPPVPTAVAGTLTFSAVTATSMTLNWPNWATNETGYLVWNSTDGVNYSFLTQTAVNATSSSFTGLIPGTTYFWRVYAVTEGCLSTPLSATQATLPAVNKVSNVTTGNWNTPGAWLPVGVPTASDNVTILNGHTITVNADALCNNLTVGQGTSGALSIGNNATARLITVNNNLTVNTGGSMTVNTGSNTTHTLNLKNNLVNNGTFNLQGDANSHCTCTFTRNGNQSVSGTGAVNSFYTVTVNMGITQANVLSVTSTNFNAPSDFLTLTNGTFRLANSAATSIVLFSSASTTIGTTAGFALANANATVSIQGELVLEGNLIVNAGSLFVGNGPNENLISNGGELEINGGSMSIAGRYSSSTINNLSRFEMTGGTLTVATNSTTGSTTEAPFNVTAPGSVVVISGGTIIIPREGGAGPQNLGYTVTDVINSSVTGGVLQIGSTASPSNQIMNINTVLPVGNLLVAHTNARARLTNALTVVNDVTVTAGVLDANNLDLTLGGDWTDNATFIPGTGTVIFNGSDLQTITDPTGESFNNLTCSSSDTVRLLSPIDINANLVINSGSTLDAGPTNQPIDIQRHWTNMGNFYSRQGVVNFNGVLFQNLTSTTTTHFFDITTNNVAGVNVVSGTYEVEGAYTPTLGVFNVSGATSFTLLSDATRTARIAQAGTGTVTGTMHIQRYISARGAGYSDMSSPVTASTFLDWDNELLLVYAYLPPTYYPSAWSYDEAAWDYVPVTASSEVLTPGKGFEVYLDSDGSYTTFNTTTIDSRGTPTIGNVNISSSLSNVNDGWNLVGNPYASYVSWNSLFTTSTGVGNTIQLYDEVAADFELQTAASGFEIPPHQGFWIQATSGSPSVIFTEAKKTTTSTSVFKSLQNGNFSLKLESLQREHFFTSKTQFVPMAGSEFDEDIRFRGVPHPLAPQLYSVNNDLSYRLKQIDETKDEVNVDLGFSVGENGVYSISSLNLLSAQILGYTCVVLKDAVNGHEFVFNGQNAYRFYAKTTDDKHRFSLSLRKKGDCYPSLNNNAGSVYFVTLDNKINVNIEGEVINGTIQLVNMLGQQEGDLITANAKGTYTVEMPAEKACYLLVATVNGKQYLHKFISR